MNFGQNRGKSLVIFAMPELSDQLRELGESLDYRLLRLFMQALVLILMILTAIEWLLRTVHESSSVYPRRPKTDSLATLTKGLPPISRIMWIYKRLNTRATPSTRKALEIRLCIMEINNGVACTRIWFAAIHAELTPAPKPR